jgi:hypothetical protein
VALPDGWLSDPFDGVVDPDDAADLVPSGG